MEKVMNMTQLCAYLGISDKAVIKLIYTKGLPYFKIGNKYKLNFNSIQKWIKHQEKLNKTNNCKIQCDKQYDIYEIRKNMIGTSKWSKSKIERFVKKNKKKNIIKYMYMKLNRILILIHIK